MEAGVVEIRKQNISMVLCGEKVRSFVSATSQQILENLFRKFAGKLGIKENGGRWRKKCFCNFKN